MSNITPISSAELKKTISQDGFTVTIVISKVDGEPAWAIEIVDEFGGATMWDTTFPSTQAAMDAAMQAIDEHGIEAFLFADELDPMNLPTLNRAAITVTGKQACVDWINTLNGTDPAVTLADINHEATTYVVDEMEELFQDEDPDALIKAHFEMIFDSELTGWHLDPEAWPENRDWNLFTQFFSYTISTIVFDLGREPVETEDF